MTTPGYKASKLLFNQLGVVIFYKPTSKPVPVYLTAATGIFLS